MAFRHHVVASAHFRLPAPPLHRSITTNPNSTLNNRPPLKGGAQQAMEEAHRSALAVRSSSESAPLRGLLSVDKIGHSLSVFFAFRVEMPPLRPHASLNLGSNRNSRPIRVAGKLPTLHQPIGGTTVNIEAVCQFPQRKQPWDSRPRFSMGTLHHYLLYGLRRRP